MKKGFSVYFSVFLILIVSLFSFPLSAFAENEVKSSPYLYAEYFSEDGKRADGNILSSGNYKMQFVLEGVSSLSEMEFTANYGSEVVFNNFSTIADNDTSVNALCRIENNNLILCFVSLNDDYTEVNSDGTVLFTADITVNSDSIVDMKQVVPVSTDPNFFFIETNYGDIDKSSVPYSYNCYGLDENSEYSFSGTVTTMVCDLSPELPTAHSVSAYIGALAKPTASFGTYPVSGAVVTAGGMTSVTDSNGQFVIDGLIPGTYEATVTYKYGLTRNFTIVVSDSDIKSDIMVGIVSCDLSEDKVINNGDYSLYKKYIGVNNQSDRYILGYDFNVDGVINNGDYAIYKKFIGKNIQNMIYDETIIKN